MKNKIRFLATGDFHSDTKLINNIEKYNDLDSIDYILFLGDLSDKKKDFKKLLSKFKNKPILMVPGNHETKKQLKILENHYNVHFISKNTKQIHKDLVIFGPNNLNIGENSTDESSILNNLIEKYNEIKDIKFKIMLSHIPASNTKIGDASPFFPYIGGSIAIKEFLENFKVDLSLVGHIHETSGLEEIVSKNKVLNVAKTSKIIEFDINKKEINIF